MSLELRPLWIAHYRIKEQEEQVIAELSSAALKKILNGIVGGLAPADEIDIWIAVVTLVGSGWQVACEFTDPAKMDEKFDVLERAIKGQA